MAGVVEMGRRPSVGPDGVDRARDDAVGPDPAQALLGQCARQADQARLGRDHVDAAPLRPVGAETADVDDGAVPVLRQTAEQLARRQERAGQRYVEDRRPGGARRRLQGFVGAYRGVVDEDGHRSEPGGDLVEAVQDGGLVVDAHQHAAAIVRAAVDCVQRLRQRRPVRRAPDADPGAGGAEGLRDREADVPAAAGHQGHFRAQIGGWTHVDYRAPMLPEQAEALTCASSGLRTSAGASCQSIRPAWPAQTERMNSTARRERPRAATRLQRPQRF